MEVYTVVIPDEVRDMVQRAGLEYNQKKSVISGLLEDHRYDEDASFIDSEIFQAYESKMAKAMYAFDSLKKQIEKEYMPDEVKGRNCKWNLDYDTCEMTFRVTE